MSLLKPYFVCASCTPSARRAHNVRIFIFTIIGVLLVALSPLCFCQQSYHNAPTTEDCLVEHSENAGYMCEADTPRCETFAYFRVQPGIYATLSAISYGLFNTSPPVIASVSGLAYPNASLSLGQGLYIPMTCTCYGNHSSQNVTYIIQAGNTFLKVANRTYEGLTTCQAIQDANPQMVVTDLQIGDVAIMPIRCACPSAKQKLMGIVSLVTYPIADGDDVKSIIEMFGVVEQHFLAANSIPNTSVVLFTATTVLLPFIVMPINPPNTTSPSSSSDPSIISVSSSSVNSKTGIYVGVPVTIMALLLAAAFAFILSQRKRKKAHGQSFTPSIHIK